MNAVATAPVRRFRTLNGQNFLDRLPELFQQNHIVPPASRQMDGHAYETFDAEDLFVRELTKTSPRRVATVIEGEGGAWYVSPGFHFVNRLFHLVAKEGVELPPFRDFRY